jgi:hypothetical protein
MYTPQTVELAYIGNRATKTDNVCGTGTVWIGYGDIQKVERKHVPEFLKHPLVWMLESDFQKLKTESASSVLIDKPLGDEQMPSAAPQAGLGDADSVLVDDQNKGEITDGTPPERIAVIKNAILSLEQGNPQHFSTTNGVPIVSAVRNMAGDETIAAADVRAAWNEINGKAA